MCGVDISDVERDYEISSFFAPRRYRCGSDLADWTTFVDDLNTYNRGVTFQDKCIYYLHWIGITDTDINTILNELIEGSVPVVTDTRTEVFDSSAAALNARLKASGGTSSYTSTEGNILVTDFIPVSKFDIIELHSDMAQSDTYAGYAQVYDGNKTRLYTAQKTNTGVWEWNDQMTVGTYKLWNMYRATDIINWDVQYMRFVFQYSDINNVSIIKR